MTWPSSNVPATAPTTHGGVRTQAYQAGGGDYFRSGYYSHGFQTSQATAAMTLSLGLLVLRPFIVPVCRAFDRIGVNVTTAATAGGVLRFGIYGPGSGFPGALLLDAGTVSSETTGGKELTISQTLDPGVYWLAVVAQTATCGVTRYGTNAVTPWFSATTSPPSTTGGQFLDLSGVTGNLPSSVAGASTTNNCPVTCLRAA